MKTISKTYFKDIYCLEGDWNKDLREHSSIKAALEFMKTNCGINFIHRHCGTKESLFYYLDLWKSKKYSKHSICYLAFHGRTGSVKIGDDFVKIEELGEILQGACTNKIIHFGSCLTMNVNEDRIKEFMQKTGALCVCGFQKKINFLESSVFDMLLIDMFQKYKEVSCVDRDMQLYYQNLIDKLEFKIFY